MLSLSNTVRLAKVNWKTTALGIIQACIILFHQAVAYLDNDPATVLDWNIVTASLTALFIGIFARDGGTSSEVERKAMVHKNRNPRNLVAFIPLVIATVLLTTAAPTTVFSQEGTAISSSEFQDVQVVEAAAGDSFHREVIRTALSEVRKGNLSRRDMIRLRVAMLSPSFREHAKELAIIQMASSGSENLPFTESGTVDEAAIDWEGLTAFMEKFIPLLLKLIEAIAGMGLADYTIPLDYSLMTAMLHQLQPDLQLAA